MDIDLADLGRQLDLTARESGLSGVVSLSRGAEVVFREAYGLADRAHGVANTPETRFATASATKGFTALAIASLVDDSTLTLATPVRDVLGDDLPLIDDAVTVEHLLSHTSGIGDYLDEEAGGEIDDYILTVAVHELADTDAFLPMLDGHPQRTSPGETFSYNNGGFMALALVAERASGTRFHDLVQERVFDRAGLERTGFLRLDELPGDAAIGYLSEDPESLRTNVLHLPVRGNGDGGAFTTASDLVTFWHAFFEGGIVDAVTAAAMVTPKNIDESEDMRYGLGFYLDLDGPGVILTGYDAGVSSWTRFDPATGLCATVLSNTPEGAWATARRANEVLTAS